MEARSRPSRLSTGQGLLVSKDVPGKGRGVFAAQRIRAGDEVLDFKGEVRDVSAFEDLTHALQVGPREFLCASGDIDDYVNHSCEPNCGVRDDGDRTVLFALTDIHAGEEITFDYATTQTGGFFVFDCNCGADQCRGLVGDFDELPLTRKKYYISRGALLSYLLTT